MQNASSTFCDLCVTTRFINGASHRFCRHCGAECQPIQARIRPAESPPGFLASLPRALLYPFQGSGVIMLVAGTAFFYLLGHLPLIGLILTGYLFNYAKSIITSTANGRKDPPDWPDFSDWKEDILFPYIQLIALVVLAFGPAFVIGVWRPGTETEARIAYFIALGFGALLAPMGMLALAMFDTLAALNPIALTWSILRVPLHYLVAAAAFETGSPALLVCGRCPAIAYAGALLAGIDFQLPQSLCHLGRHAYSRPALREQPGRVWLVQPLAPLVRSWLVRTSGLGIRG